MSQQQQRIPAPCFEYLCGICERRGTCKYTHQYLICHDMCNAYKCKMWSLSEQEIQEIKGNRRPFSEKITREIDRMAYVIISAKKPRPKHLCPRFLTGRDCTNVEFPCDICPQYYNMKDLPKCHKCNVFLLGGVSWGLQCGHVFCEVCELTLEVDKNGPLPKAKCCICRWGEAVLMVAMK